MPKKYTKKKYPIKRNKKKTSRDLSNNIPAGLPQKMTIKMTYAEFTSLNPAAGLAASYVYSANSAFDPNTTGGGHQPLYFDQLMTLYDHYTVIGARIEVTFINTNALLAAVVGVRLTDDATVVSTPTELLENTRNQNRILGPRGSNNTCKLVATCNPSKFLRGSSKGSLMQSDLQGTVGSSPSDQCFFQIFGMAADGSSDSGNLEAQVTITYITVFQEPRQDVASS